MKVAKTKPKSGYKGVYSDLTDDDKALIKRLEANDPTCVEVVLHDDYSYSHRSESNLAIIEALQDNIVVSKISYQGDKQETWIALVELLQRNRHIIHFTFERFSNLSYLLSSDVKEKKFTSERLVVSFQHVYWNRLAQYVEQNADSELSLKIDFSGYRKFLPEREAEKHVNSKINEDRFAELCEALSHKKVNSLVLAGNSITESHINSLLGVLQSLKSLARLDLSYRQLEEESVVKCLEALRGNENIAVKELNFIGNKLASAFDAAYASFWEQNSQLTHLHLDGRMAKSAMTEGNRLHEALEKKLQHESWVLNFKEAGLIAGSGFEVVLHGELLEASENGRWCKELYLKWVKQLPLLGWLRQLHRQGSFFYTDLIKNVSKLFKGKLQFGEYSQLLIDKLVEYLRVALDVHSINLSLFYVENGNIPKSEIIKNYSFTAETLLRLCDAIANNVNTKIEELILRGMPCNEDVVQAIVRVMQQHRLVSLDLTNTGLKNPSLRILSGQVGKDNSLGVLLLEDNQFDGTALAILAERLKQNKTLYRLSLKSESITFDSMQGFLEKLKTNKALTTVDAGKAKKLDTAIRKNVTNADQLVADIQLSSSSEAIKKINLGVSPYRPDSDGNTPIHHAVEMGMVDFLQALAKKHFNFHIHNNQAKTPLDLALALPDDSPKKQQIVDILNNKRSQDATQLPPAKKSKQQATIASMFAAKQQSQPQPAATTTTTTSTAPISTVASQELQAMYVAIANGEIDRVKGLLATNATLLTTSYFGMSILHVALRFNQEKLAIELCEQIIRSKAGLQWQDEQGKTPLHIACEKGASVLLFMQLKLLDLDVNAKDVFGLTPLMYLAGGIVPAGEIANKQLAEVAYALIQAGADVALTFHDLQTGVDNSTALHKAIQQKRDGVIKEILKRSNAPINHQDGLGNTPLHYALRINNTKINLRLLLNPHCNRLIRNNAGQVPGEKDTNARYSLAAFPSQALFTSSGLHWSAPMKFLFGAVGNNQLEPELSGELAKLRHYVDNQPKKDGNVVAARLGLVVSRDVHTPGGSKASRLVYLDLDFVSDFHVTHASKVSSFKGSINRDPEILEHIVKRHQDAPQDIQTYDQPHGALQPLSRRAIETLHKDRSARINNKNFEYLMNHSEVALAEHLQMPDIIQQIVDKLVELPDIKVGTKVLAVFILMHSLHYPCINCQVQLLGLQSPKSEFSTRLVAKLTSVGMKTPVKRPLSIFSFYSCKIPWMGEAKKKKADHSKLVPDLRELPNNVLFAQDCESMEPTLTNYNSRKG